MVTAQLMRHAPTASLTHFLVKLDFAAPDSFRSAAVTSHALAASLSHFFMKLVSAASASFLSAAEALQVSLQRAAGFDSIKTDM
ncbi:hypothetical protein AB4Z40_08360 [Bosea sp. 2YAB26]|uniref:hypothetical protein n=1 Tax=Bosea sp. 2YAB26 TaxID=3237478 RepID=UPI003F8EED35